jgi:hypothetical protein
MKRSAVTSMALAIVIVLVLGCNQEPAPPADSPENRAEEAQLLAGLEAAAGGYERMLDDGAELAASATTQALVLELGREPTDEEASAVQAIMRSALAEVLTEEAWLEGVSGVYAAHLTAAELADTRAFYASDAGQRILHVAPMIDNDVEAALGSLFDAHEDQLAELIDGGLAERFPELAEEDSDG